MPGNQLFNSSIGISDWRKRVASLGRYLLVTNPTPGTGIAYALQTGFSATANGLLLVQNTNPKGSGVMVALDRLKLIQIAAAPTGTLAMRMEAFAESGLVNLTGNFLARTPVNINTLYSDTNGNADKTGVVVQSFNAGAATVPAQAAGATRKLLGIGALQTGVAVQHDSYVWQFGGADQPDGSAPLAAARATHPAQIVAHMPPITIAPQWSAWLNLWWITAALNVPSFEFELGLSEL